MKLRIPSSTNQDFVECHITVLLALLTRRRETLTTEALFLYFLLTMGNFYCNVSPPESGTVAILEFEWQNIKVSLGKLRLSLQRGFLWHDHRCHQTPEFGERSTSTGKSKAAWVENILWTRGPAYWCTIVVKVFTMNFLQQHRCNCNYL